MSTSAKRLSLRRPGNRVARLALSAIVTALLASVSLSACASRTEPLVQQLANNTQLSSFTFLPESAQGNCGGVPVCSDKFYELAFTAPESVSADRICSQVFALASDLGADGYSRDSHYPTASRLAGNETNATDFCLTSMQTELVNWDATTFYSGMILYVPGVDDGLAKIMTLRHRNDGVYVLTVGFSRDPGRGEDPAAWTYTDAAAQPLTQAELDDANDFAKIAAETMNFATTLIGMSEADAVAAIVAKGYSHRIAERDGKQFALTEDYSPTRINLLVRDNKVFDVWVG